MRKTVDLIVKEALQLSDAERAQVVDELLTTLEVEKDNDVDAAWAAEVEKRASELAAGNVVPVIWDEVKERARHRSHGKN